MPIGVPKAGFRRRGKNLHRQANAEAKPTGELAGTVSHPDDMVTTGQQAVNISDHLLVAPPEEKVEIEKKIAGSQASATSANNSKADNKEDFLNAKAQIGSGKPTESDLKAMTPLLKDTEVFREDKAGLMEMKPKKSSASSFEKSTERLNALEQQFNDLANRYKQDLEERKLKKMVKEQLSKQAMLGRVFAEKKNEEKAQAQVNLVAKADPDCNNVNLGLGKSNPMNDYSHNIFSRSARKK